MTTYEHGVIASAWFIVAINALAFWSDPELRVTSADVPWVKKQQDHYQAMAISWASR